MKMITEYIAPIGKKGLHILETGDWRTKRPILNQDTCIKCGICFLYCPVNSIDRIDGNYTISYDYCKGCGICANECPKGSITMEDEVRK